MEDSPQYDRKLGVPLFDCIAAVCHDSLYDYESLSLRGRSRQERGNGDEKNSKTGAVILIALGLLCAVSTVKSCGTKRAAIQEKVDDVVYVGQGSYDPANDGKVVIVCGELKVLEQAYDDELGLTIDAPRAMRSAKK